ncbi:HAMP domain-containing sensor histidine kinase [Caballeronia sp. GACF4]|uniref:sensor histidine kinase n=1 Tax=Caballeronia sp. GACF4 TaxID=2921763 RepID=UPI0020291A29|nr:HAMP domain-containing sensor histidine kinase [Caballeronia sp. GACF4]
MMHNFLSNNRSELVERCRAKVASRPTRAASDAQLKNGVPMFLDQLIKTLRIEQGSDPLASRAVSGAAGGIMTESEMGATAGQHGHALHLLGYTIAQVVHDYGDLCQAITDLAHERDVPFQINEYRTLNRCLDNAIAKAVTEFSYQRAQSTNQEQQRASQERAGELAHELRNALSIATTAFEAARTGSLSLTGATGTVLQRGLASLRTLIDGSIADVKELADGGTSAATFSLADFITEVAHAAELAAQVRGVKFTVSPVDSTLAVSADRDALYSALGNLLQNAFKFTRPQSEVSLNAYAVAGRILMDVKDHCGGLPPDSTLTMFEPFTQQSADKSGLGLGLSISKKIVETYGGVLSVANLPGVGCIFTINLARHSV